MSLTIFSATGCARCKIVKRFMEERQIEYVEKDMKAEGKEDFQNFYKANRSAVFRGPDGVEFPIIVDGGNIRQSIGAAIAYLHAGEKLDGFFSVGTLHGEWVNGIHLSQGNPAYGDELFQALQYIKSNNLKLQIDTDGRNSEILRRVLEEGLADVLIVNVLGPLELYPQILGRDVDPQDILKSLSLLSKFPDSKLQTTIQPVKREDGSLSYLTPAEVAAAAKLIQETTGSNKWKYLIKQFKPGESINKAGQGIKPLQSSELFGYRTKARDYQVHTEIERA
jgi:pyruvate formate lyase activating enzyme